MEWGRRRPWPPGAAGHVLLSVPRGQVAEVERVYAVGQRVNVSADGRADGWIRVTELRRTREGAGEVLYLLAFAACDPPAPPN